MRDVIESLWQSWALNSLIINLLGIRRQTERHQLAQGCTARKCRADTQILTAKLLPNLLECPPPPSLFISPLPIRAYKLLEHKEEISPKKVHKNRHQHRIATLTTQDAQIGEITTFECNLQITYRESLPAKWQPILKHPHPLVSLPPPQGFFWPCSGENPFAFICIVLGRRKVRELRSHFPPEESESHLRVGQLWLQLGQLWLLWLRGNLAYRFKNSQINESTFPLENGDTRCFIRKWMYPTQWQETRVLATTKKIENWGEFFFFLIEVQLT